MRLCKPVTQFVQQNKTKTAIKTSVDKMNYKMENTIIKFPDLDMCLNVTDPSLEEMDLQSSNITTAKFEHLALPFHLKN